MPDRGKVIKGLEETEIMLTQAVDRGGEMAVMGAFKCLNRVTDALALLKEQEPRVLTLEEVQNDCLDYVYLEWHGCCICCIKDEDESDRSAGYFVYGLDGDYFRFLWNTYGVIWRCWTAMPTGKQIKAVKWNE